MKVNKKLIVLTAIGTSAYIYKRVSDYTHDMLYRYSIVRNELQDNYTEIVRLRNHDGLIICGYLYERGPGHKTIIMMHRFLEDSTSLINEINYFKEHTDANILAVDAKAHGLSDGYHRGFGYEDITDLMLWNRYILKRYGQDHKILMYGQGLGASCILMCANKGKLKNVEAIISDGACADTGDYLVKHCFKKTAIPDFISYPIIKRMIRNEIDCNLSVMTPMNHIEDNKIPTLFMHSRMNKDVPLEDVFTLYNHAQCEKELFPVKEAYFYTMKDNEYAQTLISFINTYFK